MTSEKSAPRGLDDSLQAHFDDVGRVHGLRFNNHSVDKSGLRIFTVCENDNQDIIGIVTLHPHTTRTTSAFSKEAGLPQVNIRLNLPEPEADGKVAMSRHDMNTLKKLSGHALLQLSASRPQ